MWNRYKRDDGGNVAVMFAIMLTTLLLGIGAAVDYAGITSQRQELQDMVDAATLAAAKEDTTNAKKMKRIAEKFMSEHKVKGQKIKLELVIVDDEVQITATTTYDTVLMGMIGHKKMDVVAQAASPIAAFTPVKVALVLDTTTSMEGANIAALKTAATAMIEEFETFEAPVAVSVVPFAQYVNVGLNNKGRNWLDIRKDGETREHCWNERKTITPRTCTKTGNTIYYDDIRDGRNFGKKSRDEKTCTDGEYEYTGERLCRTVELEWKGCVGSRVSPHNEQAVFDNNRITGVMDRSCGTPLLPLTKKMITVKATISSLKTHGSTYLPSGTIWGWRTLQDGEPFESNVNMKRGKNKTSVEPAKAMVIMTDGDNTLSQGGSEPHLHNGSDGTKANARTLAICKAAKADGIQVFTVGYRMDDVSTQTLLEACASSPSHFSRADNAEQLKQVFKEIAGQLDFTRLSI